MSYRHGSIENERGWNLRTKGFDTESGVQQVLAKPLLSLSLEPKWPAFSCSLLLPPSLSLTHSLSLSYSFSLTLSYSLTLLLSYSLTLLLALTHSLTHSLTRSLARSRSLSLLLALSLSLSLSYSLSLSLTHSLTHSLTLSLPLPPPLSLSLLLSFFLSYFLSFSLLLSLSLSYSLSLLLYDLTNDGPCERTKNPNADTGDRSPFDRANRCAHSRYSQPLTRTSADAERGEQNLIGQAHPISVQLDERVELHHMLFRLSRVGHLSDAAQRGLCCFTNRLAICFGPSRPAATTGNDWAVDRLVLSLSVIVFRVTKHRISPLQPVGIDQLFAMDEHVGPSEALALEPLLHRSSF